MSKLTKILYLIGDLVLIAFGLIFVAISLILGSIVFEYISKPYREFMHARNDNLNEIRLLTENKPKELLLYRRKQHLDLSSSVSEICYVSYIALNSEHKITKLKLQNNGYKQIDKSFCVANSNNLANLKSTFAAPNFRYLGEKTFLVFGSMKNLDISSISDTKTEIWHKKGYEIIFYPQKNIIQVNRLWSECFGPFGMCN